MADDQDSELGAQPQEDEALFAVRMVWIGNNAAILVMERGLGFFK